jgi:hypothetical protein
VDYFIWFGSVDAEFAVLSGDPDMLGFTGDIDEDDVWIFGQFFRELAHQRQVLPHLNGCLTQIMARREMHPRGDKRSREPKMDVGAAGDVFIDINPDDAFMKGVGRSYGENTAESKSRFSD